MELAATPELDCPFGIALLQFCLNEGGKRGYVEAYNVARFYSVIPCPASTQDHAKESLHIILEKGKKFSNEAEREAILRNYFLAAVASQREMKAAYLATNQPLRAPSTYDFDEKVWKSRAHRAANLHVWGLLTESEVRAAHEADFTVNEIPVDACDFYCASAASNSAPRARQPGRTQTRVCRGFEIGSTDVAHDRKGTKSVKTPHLFEARVTNQ